MRTFTNDVTPKRWGVVFVTQMNKSSSIKYVVQSGGGGKPMYYIMVNMVCKMVILELLRVVGGGSQIMVSHSLWMTPKASGRWGGCEFFQKNGMKLL